MMPSDGAAVALSRHFPLDDELRLLDELLSQQLRDLPQSLEDNALQRELGKLVEQVTGGSFPQRLSLLLHPAVTDWHFSFVEQVRRSLAEGHKFDEREIVEALVTALSGLAEGNETDSRAVEGTPFRITSTATWARKCLRTTISAHVECIDIAPAGSGDLSADEVAFVADLVQAVKVLEQNWPEAWNEIRQTIRYVIPFRCKPTDSFTSSKLLSAVFISPRLGDPVSLAEALVHEARHNRLHMLERRGRLFENDNACRYWSPWKQTERPFRGIIHGTYSFIGVGRFHGLLMKRGHPLTPSSLRRIMEESDRVFGTLRLMNRHGRWTENGRKMLGELEEEAIQLLECRDCLMQRLCPGFVRAPDSKEVIREVLANASNATAGNHKSRQRVL